MFIINFLLSAILVIPPEIPEKSSRWEEVYIAFLQDFYYVLFCFSHFVARESASDHCIRRMSVQKGAQGQGGHCADHLCSAKN